MCIRDSWIGSFISGVPSCAITAPSTYSTIEWITLCGCTTTCTSSISTLKSHLASITSSPLLTMVEESIVILRPIAQFGCFKASSTRIFRRSSCFFPRNGPPAVSYTHLDVYKRQITKQAIYRIHKKPASQNGRRVPLYIFVYHQLFPARIYLAVKVSCIKLSPFSIQIGIFHSVCIIIFNYISTPIGQSILTMFYHGIFLYFFRAFL